MKSILEKVSLLRVLVILTGLLSGAHVTLAAEDWQSLREGAHALYGRNDGTAIAVLGRAQEAAVPTEDLSMILSRGAGRSVSAADFSGLVDRLVSVRRDHLPVRPFTEKILEGFAKNVPTPLILSVLDRKLETYLGAKAVMGNVAGEGEEGARALDSVSLAMERGVSSQALRELYSSASVKDPNVIYHSAQALADLESMGFPEDQGVRVVRAGIRSGYLETGHSTLIQVVARAKKAGRSFQDITDTMESSLGRGRSLSETSVFLQGNRAPGASGRRDNWRGGMGSGGPGGTGSPGSSGGRGRR